MVLPSPIPIPQTQARLFLELTNEMVTHLVQHRLHVFTAQALGTHKALQHPKHAAQSPLGSTAGTGDEGYTQSQRAGVKPHPLWSHTHPAPPEIPYLGLVGF